MKGFKEKMLTSYISILWTHPQVGTSQGGIQVQKSGSVNMRNTALKHPQSMG